MSKKRITKWLKELGKGTPPKDEIDEAAMDILCGDEARRENTKRLVGGLPAGAYTSYDKKWKR